MPGSKRGICPQNGGDCGSPKRERRAITLYLDAIKSDREPGDLPDWVHTLILARRLGVMPSVVDEEPLEWMVRLLELTYQEGKQGISLWPQ